MKNKDKRKGKVCYYCETVTKLEILKFGPVQFCPNCKAYVSLSMYTGEPKGSLADAELRRDRRIAHRQIDILVKRLVRVKGISINEARENLYIWISTELNLDITMESLAQLFPDETKQIIQIMNKYTK